MIKSKDRSGYIGASDTKYVIGNWETKTFKNWWLVKLGISTQDFQNVYTLAGTNYEHKIIEALNIPNVEKDKQIILGHLRVNLDANTDEKIIEIKTYQYEKGFDLKKHKDYVNQVQVQMYVSKIYTAEIAAYGLIEKDYKNYFNEIDLERLSIHSIKYDEEWINKEYLPKEKYLEYCLEKGKFPSMEEFLIGEKMKIVMKDEGFKHFSKKDVYEWEEILGIIEEMEDEIVSLNKKISDMEDDIRDNYKPISYAEQVGYSERDFY